MRIEFLQSARAFKSNAWNVMSWLCDGFDLRVAAARVVAEVAKVAKVAVVAKIERNGVRTTALADY